MEVHWIYPPELPITGKRVLTVAETESGAKFQTIAQFQPKGSDCEWFYEDPPELWYNIETERHEFQADTWIESAWQSEEWTELGRVICWAELPKLPEVKQSEGGNEE